jgi:hypothetical protein
VDKNWVGAQKKKLLTMLVLRNQSEPICETTFYKIYADCAEIEMIAETLYNYRIMT